VRAEGEEVEEVEEVEALVRMQFAIDARRRITARLVPQLPTF